MGDRKGRFGVGTAVLCAGAGAAKAALEHGKFERTEVFYRRSMARALLEHESQTEEWPRGGAKRFEAPERPRRGPEAPVCARPKAGAIFRPGRQRTTAMVAENREERRWQRPQ